MLGFAHCLPGDHGSAEKYDGTPLAQGFVRKLFTRCELVAPLDSTAGTSQLNSILPDYLVSNGAGKASLLTWQRFPPEPAALRPHMVCV